MKPIDALALRFTELHLGAFVADTAFVYVLSLDSNIIYVGQTTNLIARLGQHANTRKFDRVFFLETSKADADLVEGALTRALNPSDCTKTPKDVGRDAEVLARFGLTPDPEAAFAQRLAALYRAVGDRHREKVNTPEHKEFLRAVKRRLRRERRKLRKSRVSAFIEAA